MTLAEIDILMAHMADLGAPPLQSKIRERLIAALYTVEATRPAAPATADEAVSERISRPSAKAIQEVSDEEIVKLAWNFPIRAGTQRKDTLAFARAILALRSGAKRVSVLDVTAYANERAEDELRGEMAFKLTKRHIFDMPTARALVDEIRDLRSGASAQHAGGALKEAFEEGFYSAQTYNDVLVNTSDAAWQESRTRAGTAQPAKEQPHDR